MLAELDLQGLLPSADGAEVRHRPVQVGQFQQTLNHAQRLPQRLAKKTFDAQAELDGGIRKRLAASALATGLGMPLHVLVQPNRQRSTGL